MATRCGSVGWVTSLALQSACGGGFAGGMAATVGPVVARTTAPAPLRDPDGVTRSVDASIDRFDLDVQLAAGSARIQALLDLGLGGSELRRRDADGDRALRGTDDLFFDGRYGAGLALAMRRPALGPAALMLYGLYGAGLDGSQAPRTLERYVRVGLLVTTPAYLTFAIGYERSTNAIHHDFGVMTADGAGTGPSIGELELHGVFIAVGLGRWAQERLR